MTKYEKFLDSNLTIHSVSRAYTKFNLNLVNNDISILFVKGVQTPFENPWQTMKDRIYPLN